jgi:phosphatidylserine decarboxylase
MTSPAWVWLSQHLIPKNLSSAVVYRATRSRRPWIRRPLIRWFARAYRVDLHDAADPDLDGYATFNEFFTRALRRGSRPIEGGPGTLVAAADGVLTEHGTIHGDRLLQAKGRAYSLAELLGETGSAVEGLRGGSYLTIYLAPRDYHRVHAPLAGALVRTRYIPGERFSVSRATAAAIGRLFCRNERVVCWFDTALGPLAVVLVGALNVSCISTVAHGEIASGAPREWREAQPVAVAQGDEVGRFNMGSTVIVLLGASAAWRPSATHGATVRMGQALADLGPPRAGR